MCRKNTALGIILMNSCKISSQSNKLQVIKFLPGSIVQMTPIKQLINMLTVSLTVLCFSLRTDLFLFFNYKFSIFSYYIISLYISPLSLLHSFIQQSLNSGSAQVQTLLMACWRFVMARISNNGPSWK